jgi:dolichol-phosphate mannosyltransferase
MTEMPRVTQDLPAEARAIKILNAPRERTKTHRVRDGSGKSVGIVLPTLDEGRNLERLVPTIEAIFAKHGIDGQIFIVDDNSRDGTDGIVMRFARTYKNVTFIRRPGKFGLGSAYRLGFKHALKAGMDIVFEMDADFSHNPSYIPAFLDCMEKINADLVIGSRYCDNGGTNGWPLKRKVISFAANAFTQLALGVSQTRDMTSGFRAYKAKTLESIGYQSLVTNGYAWQIETLYKTRMGHHVICEIPIIFHEREIGESKLGREDIKEFIFYLCRTLLSRAKHLRR